MEKPCKITVLFGRRIPVSRKTAIIFQPILPVFEGEGRIGNCKVKAAQNGIILIVFVVRIRKGVSGIDLARCFIMKHEVHLGKTGGSDFFLLSVN